MEQLKLTGLVLFVAPAGEYDKRVVILTKERGKISGFARGARRPGSALLGTLEPFCFGEFIVYEGRTAYTVQQASVTEYFQSLRSDIEGAYYGMYFLEVAGYLTREAADERDMLRLLYYSLHALTWKEPGRRLVRRIFELRAICIYGLAPRLDVCTVCGGEEKPYRFSPSRGGLVCNACAGTLSRALERTPVSESALYALRFIETAPLEKLYTFTVSAQVEKELDRIVTVYYKEHVEKDFLSLQMLEAVTS